MYSSVRIYGHEFVRSYGHKLSPPIPGTAGARQASALSMIRIDVIQIGIRKIQCFFIFLLYRYEIASVGLLRFIQT